MSDCGEIETTGYTNPLEIEGDLSTPIIRSIPNHGTGIQVEFSLSKKTKLASMFLGKTLYYLGEAGTDSKLEIRISPDGKTYRATFFSGKFKYKCKPSKLLSDKSLEFAECGEINSSDPNRDNEGGSHIVVDGTLDLIQVSDDGIVGRGMRLEFVQDLSLIHI